MAGEDPSIFRFHPGAGDRFRTMVLTAYGETPLAIRRRLESFAGVPTIFRTVPRTLPLAADDRREWAGVSFIPSAHIRFAGYNQLEIPATELGRPHIYLAEHDLTGRAFPRLGRVLHHEIGHRIDAAISGDNQVPDHPGILFSHSEAFINAIRQDIREASQSGRALPMDIQMLLNRLPQGIDTPADHHRWRGYATELFAHLYAARFTNSYNPGSGSFLDINRNDLRIFRNTGLLVDRAVTTFAGQVVMPLHPNPGDYPPGRRPLPLSPTADFQPVTGETRIDPPQPRPPF